MGRSAGGCTGSSLERKHYISITVFGLLHAATREGNALLSEYPRLFGPSGLSRRHRVARSNVRTACEHRSPGGQGGVLVARD